MAPYLALLAAKYYEKIAKHGFPNPKNSGLAPVGAIYYTPLSGCSHKLREVCAASAGRRDSISQPPSAYR